MSDTGLIILFGLGYIVGSALPFLICICVEYFRK